ncbi:hypothetical protein TVAG_423390 [Trichomonas vaginalis G3]|uniref:Uncharacterized protein n=2 Tax=Trichomonas vaginalis (strain ATCC PRA-98 / G3) TaxID=412133 RepID=A2DTH7_TRIV3|nr:hypothetical protein TVAG_423390 [Trichomonas vaginalis G3]|eukprot:XP_001328509.1 hypothetical protein [Trichomonas vaginalis G3]
MFDMDDPGLFLFHVGDDIKQIEETARIVSTTVPTTGQRGRPHLSSKFKRASSTPIKVSDKGDCALRRTKSDKVQTTDENDSDNENDQEEKKDEEEEKKEEEKENNEEEEEEEEKKENESEEEEKKEETHVSINRNDEEEEDESQQKQENKSKSETSETEEEVPPLFSNDFEERIVKNVSDIKYSLLHIDDPAKQMLALIGL